MTTPQGRVDKAAQILLVDDEEAIRDVLLDLLKSEGYEVFAAADGPTALNICRQFVRPPQLLVTDIEMPFMSGYELADTCSLLYPSMGILFVSGSVPDDSERTTMQEWNRSFLSKPFLLEDLLRKVKSLLADPAEHRLPRRRASHGKPGHGVQDDHLQV